MVKGGKNSDHNRMLSCAKLHIAPHGAETDHVVPNCTYPHEELPAHGSSNHLLKLECSPRYFATSFGLCTDLLRMRNGLHPHRSPVICHTALDLAYGLGGRLCCVALPGSRQECGVLAALFAAAAQPLPERCLICSRRKCQKSLSYQNPRVLLNRHGRWSRHLLL